MFSVGSLPGSGFGPLDPLFASAPRLCLPRGLQGVIQSNPEQPSGQGSLLPHYCHTATATATAPAPQSPNPSSATLSVSDNSLFCLLASCGRDPVATKHLIYDCFSKRRHHQCLGPRPLSGARRLHTPQPFTRHWPILQNLPSAARSPTHQHTELPYCAPRHVYFRPSTAQGYYHFQ